MNDKDSVRDAFYNIKGYEGIAGTFDYSAKDGDGLSGCNVYMIIGGEYYAFGEQSRSLFRGRLPVQPPVDESRRLS